jgi:RHS repeat-associated protein
MSETDAQAERHAPVFRAARERDALRPKESTQHAGTDTGSYVDHRNRSYTTDTTGMVVKTPGGRGSFTLVYENGAWLAGEARSDLTGFPSTGGALQFTQVCQDYGTPIITSILKDGRYAYNLPPDTMRKVTEYDAYGNISEERCEYVGEPIYLHDGENTTFMIQPADGGYRWEDTYGNWRQYAGKTDDNTSGRLLASGNRLGTTLTVLYEDGTGRVTGYADRRDALVFWLEYNTEGLLESVQDADTRQITYTYETNGRLHSVNDVIDHETTYTYTEDGKITKISQPGGREVNVTYTTYGDVASVTDAGGRGYRFNFAYNAQKEEYYAMVTSTSGRITEYWYDDEGETTRIDVNGETVRTITKDGNAEIITDERGYETRKTYDEWENLTRMVYPDGATVSYEYEHTYNRRTRDVDARGYVTEYTYDDDGNLIEQIETAGTDDERVTAYDYDDNGDLKRISLQLADGSLAVTSMEYDANGNLSQITDPEQHVIRFSEYDNMGNARAMLDARGKTWRYSYDAMGRLTAITDPLSQTTERVYEAAGNLAKIIAPAGDGQRHETIYTYDLHDQLISIQDAAGGITTFTYNNDGKLLTQVDPALRKITYAYDEFGRQISITDGNDNVITLEYDSLSSSTGSCSSCSGGGQSLPARVTYPSGLVNAFRYDTRSRKTEERQTFTDPDTQETITQITRYRYDPSGNLIEQVDPEGRRTSYTYDALNRLLAVTDEVGRTSYSYHALGNLTSLTDAESQTTTFSYDLNGRLVAEARPLGQTTQYQYDAAGNLVRKTDAKLKEITYVYDDAGRLIALTSDAPGLPAAVSGPGLQSQQCTFSYDAAGNLTGYDDGLTSASYAYDALNRKTSETLTYSAELEGLSGALTKSFSYTYFANNLKSSFTMPDGATYTYEYGENNELRQVSLPGVGAITYPSYTWTRPDRVSYPGGGARTYTYDPLMRLRRLLASDPGGNALLDVQYQYDRLNNILTTTTPQGTVNYTYDAISRLTGVQVETPTAGQPDEGFTYDRVGNRTTEAGIEGEWSYNANNELLTGVQPRPTGLVDFEYTYDQNGNAAQMTLNGMIMFTYHYNTFDRLVQVDDVNGNTIAEYYYDPFGRRLWKQAGDQTTLFFSSDEGLVAEYDPTGAEIRSYGYRPGSTWTTDPLWLKQNGEYYFYHNDHLGTPQKLVKQNGAVVWSARYTAFGQATVEVDTITNNLRFPGQYFDTEIGLHYNGFRYYAPGIGRYVRTDPIGSANGENHLYHYVRNNPITMLDPLGLQAMCKAFVTPEPGKTFNSGVLHNLGKSKSLLKYLFGGKMPPAVHLCWNVKCPQEFSTLENSRLCLIPDSQERYPVPPQPPFSPNHPFPHTWTPVDGGHTGFNQCFTFPSTPYFSNYGYVEDHVRVCYLCCKECEND